MTPFLKNVAHTYCSQNEIALHYCCFVFPNRRSSLFFRTYMSEELGNRSLILPEITTISEFVNELSDKQDTDRIELLLLLYRAYQRMAQKRGMEVSPFSRFMYWGDMLISDFNEVDMNMANAAMVFANIKDTNELRTTFLTEDQTRAIEEFFGITMERDTDDTDEFGNPIERFWKHTGNADDSDCATGKFLKLWEVMYPLYVEFNEILSHTQCSYSGAIYRAAALATDELTAEDYEYKRYIFVGFNMLTESEKRIFRNMQKRGIADYYWDCNSPILHEKGNIASYFVNELRKKYPSRYDFEQENTDVPEIEIIAVPSNSGQAKVAANILKSLPDGALKPNRANALNTAIVLPDENLFIPTYTSIPSEFESVNITLGTPLRLFSVSALFTTIASLHKRMWKNSAGEYHFYHEDVKNLLSHPYLMALAPEKISQFMEKLTQSKRIMVPIADLTAISADLECIFTPIESLSNVLQTVDYISNVMQLLARATAYHNEESTESSAKLDAGILEKLTQLITRLKDTLLAYPDIDLQGETFLYLLDRLINSTSVALQGEPLKGLQIMGVLETRSLDFDNLIVLSVNEKVFPRKHFSKSMIPQNIRRGNSLSTVEHQESIFAYYFYRMIGRAKRVYLVHDSRTQSRSSGEKSRYIYQLQYLYGNHAKLSSKDYALSVSTRDAITIQAPKTPRVMERLNRYRTPENSENGTVAKYLSASALKKYMQCPLQFYLKYVEDLYTDDDVTEDFIDSATFGTIIHDTMKELYYGKKEARNVNITMDAAALKQLKSSTKVDKTLLQNINRTYYHTNIDAPATSEALLISAMAKKYIDALLDYDAARAPFTFISAEAEEKGYWDMGMHEDKPIGINFKQYIDRLDKDANGNIRIVDYKTGTSDSTTVPSLDTFFERNEDQYKYLGFFQLMLYCNYHAYQEQGNATGYRPVIYKVTQFFNQKLRNKDFELICAKDVVTDHRNYNPEFMDKVRKLIAQIFDENTPFTQTEHEGNCQYCGFSNICRR